MINVSSIGIDYQNEEFTIYAYVLNKVDFASKLKNVMTVDETEKKNAEQKTITDRDTNIETIDTTTNTDMNVEVADTTTDTSNIEVVDNSTPTYSIDTITDKQLNSLFNKNMVTSMDEAYFDYILEEDDDSEYIDIKGIFEQAEDSYVYNVQFGNQKVSLGLYDMFESVNEDGYIVIDSEKGLIQVEDNEQNTQVKKTHNKLEKIDDTPKTGDDISILGLSIMVIFSMLGTVYCYKGSR